MNRIAFLLIGVVALAGAVTFVAAASDTPTKNPRQFTESKFQPTTGSGN